jgi:uncharacterized alkaline shock family protein YloU
MDGRQADTHIEAGPGPDRTLRPPGDPLTVSHSVIVEMVRVAALEVPGVLKVSRGGPLRWLSGSPVRAQVAQGRVSVRVWILARPGHPLAPLAAQVRQAVGATIVRLLGLELGEVTVVVDGVGGWGS